MNVSTIKNAVDATELDDAVEIAMNEIGCEIDSSLTYEDARERFTQPTADGDVRAVEILDAAITRWHELEG